MRGRCALLALAAVVATVAAAQPQPVFDPDDFVDPRALGRPFFVSRLVVGGALDIVDRYRPLDGNVGFVHVANSFYWSRFQVAYKHSWIEGHDRPPLQACGCSPPVYFPTPPPRDATPAAPPPGSKDALQFAWYRRVENGAAQAPLMLRYRLSVMDQRIDNKVESHATGGRSSFSGRERSVAVDADTHLSIGGRDVFGSLAYAHTSSRNTPDNRTQNELTYTNRFPGIILPKRLLLRPTLAIGAISGRGASGINLVNPAIELFYHHASSDVNVHAIWSPVAERSGAERWRTHQQLALLLDRRIYMKMLR